MNIKKYLSVAFVALCCSLGVCAVSNEPQSSEDMCISKLNTVFEDRLLSSKEFHLIPNRYSERTKYDENRDRYKTVLPYENNKIVLSNGNYVNASYIDLNSSNRYIATQAPLEHTVGDFWQMVWGCNSQVIVTLGNDRAQKMYPYWNGEVGKTIFVNDKIKVKKVESKKIGSSIIVRTLRIKDLQSKKKRTIMHYQYTKWPDGGIPKSKSDFIRLLDLTSSPKTSPIIVHCSAGIGRTGTFCGAHIACDLIKNNNFQGIKQIIEGMRRARPGMIQHYKQYRFLREVVYDKFSGALNERN